MSSLSAHRCACAKCRSRKTHPDRACHHHIHLFFSHLNEPQRRWFAALEAMRTGHGGKRLPAQITGLSPATVRRGCSELQSGLAGHHGASMRAPGGGRASG